MIRFKFMVNIKSQFVWLSFSHTIRHDLKPFFFVCVAISASVRRNNTLVTVEFIKEIAEKIGLWPKKEMLRIFGNLWFVSEGRRFWFEPVFEWTNLISIWSTNSENLASFYAVKSFSTAPNWPLWTFHASMVQWQVCRLASLHKTKATSQ